MAVYKGVAILGFRDNYALCTDFRHNLSRFFSFDIPSKISEFPNYAILEFLSKLKSKLAKLANSSKDSIND